MQQQIPRVQVLDQTFQAVLGALDLAENRLHVQVISRLAALYEVRAKEEAARLAEIEAKNRRKETRLQCFFAVES